MNYLFIGLGGVLGAISRHYIFTQFENKITNFPYHTEFYKFLDFTVSASHVS